MVVLTDYLQHPRHSGVTAMQTSNELRCPANKAAHLNGVTFLQPISYYRGGSIVLQKVRRVSDWKIACLPPEMWVLNNEFLVL